MGNQAAWISQLRKSSRTASQLLCPTPRAVLRLLSAASSTRDVPEARRINDASIVGPDNR